VLFSSPSFLFFFLPILLGLYFVVRRDARNLLLCAASLLFYFWGEGVYVLVLLFCIAFNYVMGLWLDRTAGRRSSGGVLALAVAGNLALLIAFKYTNFLIDNFNPWLRWSGLHPIALNPIHLPLGISFFTFQALSYVIDVHRRAAPAQKNPLHFALYKTLFPQLIAGPIVRYRDVAEELGERTICVEDFARGIKRFVVGLSKKMLLANTLAVAADGVFAIPADGLTPALAWLGIICYTLQIYFDFSGYSDMAIGLGRMFGFHFLENFRYPYAAKSLTDFWRRWHISLSEWFRDYLYIPLGGNRAGRWRTYLNLTVVFALCGLWHGASWNFLLWGLFHGGFLVAERTGASKWLERSPAPVRHAYLLFVVTIGWVFFRAATPLYAWDFLRSMAGFHIGGESLSPFLNAELALALAVAVPAATPLAPFLAKEWSRRMEVEAWPHPAAAVLFRSMWPFAEVAGCMALLVITSALLASGTYNPFIYFRF
jgi:alginate O-acetyltransferase complex protein AlgI